MAPEAVQTKHSLAAKATVPPAASTQAAIAAPLTPSRSPRTTTCLPSNTSRNLHEWDCRPGPRGGCRRVGRGGIRAGRGATTPRVTAPPPSDAVRLEQDAHAVGEVGHAPQEEAALGDQ